MKKIGILCAGDREAEPFFDLINVQKITKKAMLNFYEGIIGETKVIWLYSGVCKVNAAVAAQILIDGFQVDAIINAGTAGGMDPKVRLFDLVVTERVAYHDVAGHILTDFHPWMSDVFFRSDEGLVEAARICSRRPEFAGMRIHFGVTVTGEQFIADDKRDAINKKFTPLSVDMETAAVAHVAYVNRIPFLAIRAVTDTADHSGVDQFEINCAAAAKLSAEFVIRMIENELQP